MGGWVWVGGLVGMHEYNVPGNNCSKCNIMSLPCVRWYTSIIRGKASLISCCVYMMNLRRPSAQRLCSVWLVDFRRDQGERAAHTTYTCVYDWFAYDRVLCSFHRGSTRGLFCHGGPYDIHANNSDQKTWVYTKTYICHSFLLPFN